MKKTDLGVVGFMYAVCALFLVMTQQIKQEARAYPTFVIILLFLLTTLYVIQMIIAAKRFGVTSGVAEVFEGFLPKQFFVIFIMIVLYLIAMYYIGFYISTVVFIIVSLLFLKVPKLHILLTSLFIVGLVYGAFTLFLGVKLPMGLLFK
ncbi:MAG: tripartite tricarboxylate transporter TctB family protein [Oscillospiraceae bacterium]